MPLKPTLVHFHSFSYSYAIDRSSDKKRQFNISKNGEVRIQRMLDREVTPRHQVKILAIDDGLSLTFLHIFIIVDLSPSEDLSKYSVILI